MVPDETQEAIDSLPKAQSKSDITQLDASMNCQKENQPIVPDILTASNCQEKLETLRVQSSEKQVCDRDPDEDLSSRIPEISQPCVNLAEAASTELPLIREDNDRTSHDADAIMDQEIPQELAFPFPDPAATLEIQGSARSDQGAQGTCSPPSSSVVHEGGVQPPNISYGRSMVNNVLADTSLPNNPMGQNPQMHFPLFSDPYEYELEKLRREEGNLRKNFEETTSDLMAELERKMAEARSEYDRKSKEIDVAYNAKAMEEEANRSLVAMSSLLANAFMSKCTDKSAATDLAAAVRAARSSQHSIQQQQAVETNTHMNSTAPTQPSVTAQPRPISQQAVAESESNTIMNSTAPSRPSVTAQPRPISQQTVAELITLMNSTAPPRPSSVTTEARPLHLPRCNTPQTRPPLLIPNITPSSSSPPVHGTVRCPAPHLQRFRPSPAPNTAAASTAYPRTLVQEQQQLQRNSNGNFVCLSDDDD